jgi:hypothetical protein
MKPHKRNNYNDHLLVLYLRGYLMSPAVWRYRIERSYGPRKVSISHRAMTPPFTAVFFFARMVQDAQMPEIR